MQCAKVNEPRLFDAGNHFDFDVGFFSRSAKKLRLIFCLAHGTRCYCPDFGTMRIGDSAHPCQASDAPLNCFGIELFHVARSVPDTDGFLFAGDYFKAAHNWFGHNHMETVRSDVECGNDEVVRVVCHGASLVADFDAPSPQREVQYDDA